LGVEWESYIGDDYDTYYKFIEDAIEVPSIHNIYEIMHSPTKMLECINKYLDYKYDLDNYKINRVHPRSSFEELGFIYRTDNLFHYYEIKLDSLYLTMEIKFWIMNTRINPTENIIVIFTDKAENKYGSNDIPFSDLPTIFQNFIMKIISKGLLRFKRNI
jgi:hypothetical protein